jgi:hypothetical protein
MSNCNKNCNKKGKEFSDYERFNKIMWVNGWVVFGGLVALGILKVSMVFFPVLNTVIFQW